MGIFNWIKTGAKRVELTRLIEPVGMPALESRSAFAETRTAPHFSYPDIRPSAANMQERVRESDQSVGGLDFASAIQSHRNWKNRLSKYVANESEEQLNYHLICRDDECALGKWIRGRGNAEFGHLPSFAELRAMHGQFHLAAGRIVQMHDEHHTDEAQQQLQQGDYSRYSLNVLGLLSSLYVEVSDSAQYAG